MRIFKPADIMLPSCDMHRWSVVACDQFTSEPEYWQQVRSIVGDAPSTLHMMLPEAELGLKDPEAESVKINATMQCYIDEGVFKTYRNSYIYLERTLKSGAVRRGIMGMFDLEAYDWVEGTHSPIRATEHTVEDRLPPRIRIRRNAPLEMPHIMIFMDDADNIVFSSVTKGEKVYDFELMQDGGSITGWLVADTEKLAKAAEKLGDEAVLQRKYGSADNAIIFAMGDGNHSLAAAKRHWEKVKKLCRSRNTKPHLRAMRLPSLLTSTMRQLPLSLYTRSCSTRSRRPFLPRPRPFSPIISAKAGALILSPARASSGLIYRGLRSASLSENARTSARHSPSATADISTISTATASALKCRSASAAPAFSCRAWKNRSCFHPS